MARRQTAGAKTPEAGKPPDETGLRVVDNPVEQASEAIAPLESSGVALKRMHHPETAPQRKRGGDRRGDRRHVDGLQIVDNPYTSKPERIVARALPAMVDDEMGYKKLFTRFEEAFLGKDIAALGQCLSPAFVWNLPNGESIYGRDPALDEMARRFAMPNGPKFSRSVWRFKGKTVIQTYKVKYLGPDGRWRKSRGLDVYKIRGGLIARKDAYWKMIP